MPTEYDISSEEVALDWGNALENHQVLALFPVRLETRYIGGDLKIRVYPDDIHISTHRRSWTESERQRTLAFRAVWDAGTSSEGEKQAAWRQLVTDLGAERAAWMARATPSELAVTTGLDASSWTAPAVAFGLPSRWIALGYEAGVRVAVSIGSSIPSALPVGLDPSTSPGTSSELPAWLTDFAAAESQGMALEITPPGTGFDQLLVLGVRAYETGSQGAGELGTLLEDHRYTRGLDFLAPLTPTNNLDTHTRSGYMRSQESNLYTDGAADGDQASALSADTDGGKLRVALGFGSGDTGYDVLAYPSASGATWGKAERLMRTALWGATLDYYLEQFLAPLTNWKARKVLGEHFREHVRAIGPVATLRVGTQPYGVLPVGDLDAWEPLSGEYPEPGRIDALLSGSAQRFLDPPTWDDGGVKALLTQLRDTFGAASQGTPGVRPNTTDASGDLVRALGMGERSVRIRERVVLGEDTYRRLGDSDQLDWPQSGFTSFTTGAEQAIDTLLTTLGAHGYTSSTLSPPRIARTHPMCISQESERELLTLTVGQTIFQPNNYIEELFGMTDAELMDLSIVEATFGPSGDWPLLLVLIYQGARRAIEGATWTILHARSLLASGYPPPEPELGGLSGYPAPPTITSLWQTTAASMGFTISGYSTLGDVFDALRVGGQGEDPEDNWQSEGLDAEIERWELEEYFDFWQSLDELKDLSSDEVALTFAGTLDTLSHRLDAWITSLWTRRITHVRASLNVQGVHPGGFGWLENVYPESAPTLDGFMMAPTVPQAQASAILYAGQRDKVGAGAARQALMRLDLSSRPVHDAMNLLSELRHGVPTGNVLGWMFEAWLRDELANQSLSVSGDLDTLRHSFPIRLVNESRAQVSSGADAETPATQTTLDGLQLLRAYQEDPNGTLGYLSLGSSRHQAYVAALERINTTLLAVHDLTIAEAVYQYSRGNQARAAAALDAIASEALPPLDYEFIHATPQGIGITHRVGCLLPETAPGTPASAGWADDTVSPRRKLEPRLDEWLVEQWGIPENVYCWVECTTTAGQPLGLKIALSQLSLSPLEMLEMAPGSEVAQQGVFEGFVRTRVGEQMSALGVEVDFEKDVTIQWTPPQLAPNERSMSAFFDLVDGWRRVFEKARPMDARDLAKPGLLESTTPGWVTSEAELALGDLHTALDQTRQQFVGAITIPSQAVADAINGLKQSAWGNPQATDLAVNDTLTDLPAQARWDDIIPTARAADANFLSSFVLGGMRSSLELCARYAIESVTPVVPHADADRLATLLVERVVRALPRIEAALQASELSASPDAEELFAAAKALMGPRTYLGMSFAPVEQTNLTAGLLASEDMQGGDPTVAAGFLARTSRARENLLGLGQALTLARLWKGVGNAFSPHAFKVTHLPYSATELWVATNPAPTPQAFTSLLMCVADGVDADLGGNPSTYHGWLFDAWEEVQPVGDESAGLAFQHPQPTSRPPQTILLATTPDAGGAWSLERLEKTVLQGLELAKIRAVDLDELGDLGHLLPAIYVPFTTRTTDVTVDQEDWS